jgi:hypothetical protein
LFRLKQYYRSAGGGSGSVYDDDDKTDVGSDAVSDPFARELQQAASLDEAAWNEFQRKKQDLQRQGRLAASVYATSARISNNNSTSRDGFSALDEEEGVEVQNIATFPYGPQLLQQACAHPEHHYTIVTLSNCHRQVVLGVTVLTIVEASRGRPQRPMLLLDWKKPSTMVVVVLNHMEMVLAATRTRRTACIDNY